MDHSDDRADQALPVTAEVGGEGGSYADATQQAETLKGPVGNVRVDLKAAGPGAETPPIRSEHETLDQTDRVTSPTESPDTA